MTADVPFEITLTAAPAAAPAETKVHSGITTPEERALSAVGVYVQHYRRRLAKGADGSLDDHLKAHAEHAAAAAAAATTDDIVDEDDEEETEEMLEMDPKDWKEQDHYAVLGLSKLRYRATLDDIIKGHRRKVLRHHPDKKAAQGNANDDGFFKCIQKAFEILTDATKRRQFDSVDPEVSTDVPSAKAKGDFFELYGPVFEREGRFSNQQPVRQLGDMSTERAVVESFYEFWYAFDSWRSFEYLDKEDVDGGGNRDDKRWIEGKNRKERAQRKKEDNHRIRSLVDQALKLDPRMAKFKEEDKTKRNAKKNARMEEERKAAEAKKAADEAAKKAKEAEAASAEELKKQRQAAHKQLKKEQRALKVLFKNSAYFVAAGETPSVADISAATEKLDKIIAGTHDLDVLVASRTAIEAAHAAGNGMAKVDEIVAAL